MSEEVNTINAEEPNPIPGPTVYDIKVHYGDLQAQILNDLFFLAQAAAAVDVSMSAGEVEALQLMQREELNHLAMAVRERWAEGKREEMKTRYEELEVEKALAVKERIESIEDHLEPESVDAAAYVSAFQMDEYTLIAAFDGVAGWDTDSADDLAKVFFKVARERELERPIAHMADVREDFGQALAEISEGSQIPDEMDPGDLFETLAQPTPTKDKILTAGSKFTTDRDAITRMIGG